MVRFLSFLFGVLTLCLVACGAIGVGGYLYFSRDLPDYKQLSDYNPPMLTRVYDREGGLIGEFYKERRIFTPIENIPELVKLAFVAAEDKNFYKHPGVDWTGVIRAAVFNLNRGFGQRPQGASTITQQVMKNFLKGTEGSWEWKVKEAILAFRFEQTFSKDRILELYLNQIFLGAGSYGVTTASQIYFNKPLDQLTLSEAAYLAGLPKAPSNYHPLRDYDRAIGRRNYVIDQILEMKLILPTEAEQAKLEPLVTEIGQRNPEKSTSSYAVEEIRRTLKDISGDGLDNYLQAGYTVRSTIDPQLQAVAQNTLRKHLDAFDRGTGYHGPVQHIDILTDPTEALSKMTMPSDLIPWELALVTAVNDKTATILLQGETDQYGLLNLKDHSWAWPSKGYSRSLKSMGQILTAGDVIYVESLDKDSQNYVGSGGNYILRQTPSINGALMLMEAHTGRVLAMQGGYSYGNSNFNRATQALRQPGSSFKPIVYTAALDHGFTPLTRVSDDPVSFRGGDGKMWSPSNFDHKSIGFASLRKGIERSRNLMTVRIADKVGMNIVEEYAQKLGVVDTLPKGLASSLGSGETTLARMISAYSTFATGGYRSVPTLIDRIQDREGHTLTRAEITNCEGCVNQEWSDNPAFPSLPQIKAPTLDPMTAYQMASMLEGVVQRGTAQKLKALGQPLAGKTGTTNNAKDVWFVGFTPDLVVGCYLGYDNPRSLGHKATAGKYAVPVIQEFLTEVLKKYPSRPFSVPQGMVGVPMGDGRTEYLKPGTENMTRSGGGGSSFEEDINKADGFYDPNAPISYQDLFNDDEPVSGGSGSSGRGSSSGGEGRGAVPSDGGGNNDNSSDPEVGGFY